MSNTTYLKMTCTNCGVYQKTINWFKLEDSIRFTSKCHHCDPIYPKHKKKDNTNDVNTYRKTI